jgi:predicted transcriptional regulator
MAIDDTTRAALREMGLNAYEIDAYLVLVSGGQLTAMEISEHAGVPYSKMYEVLNSLKEKGWIKSTESRPFKYYPVPPLEATRLTRLRIEDKYVNLENTVAQTLQPLYEQRELVERPEMIILRGQQQVLTKLVGGSAIKKSVKIKFMAAGTKQDWAFVKKFGGLVELRIRDHMFGGGIIIDGKEAMLFLGEDKPTLVIWSNHVGLVGFAREYFQFLWDSSANF